MSDLIARWVLDPFAWAVAGVVFAAIEVVLPGYFFLGMGIAGIEVALVVWLFGGVLTASGYPLALSLVLLASLTVANWFLIKRFLPYHDRNADQAQDINDY